MDRLPNLPAQKDWSLHALKELFPSVCGVACAIEQRPAPPLPEAEAIAVRAAAEVRKSSFAAGRTAAREALEKIGFPRAIIPAGADRAPVWPPGATGSLSHSGGLAVAVAARLADVAALGVDLEETGAVTPDLWRQIMTEGEERFLASRPFAEQGRFATVIFSIKEAFYKFQYPHTRRLLDFRELEVAIDAEAMAWESVPAEPIAIAGKTKKTFRGLFRLGERFTLAAVYERRAAS